MNTARYWFTMVAIKYQLFAIGGYDSFNTMETITMNGTSQWNQQTMPFSVWAHCAVTVGDTVIVIGGRDENHDVC